MNIRKEQSMNMYFDKIIWYSTYVDCLSRILTEFIENGDDNIQPTDIPTLAELLTKFSSQLHSRIPGMKSDWEFLE